MKTSRVSSQITTKVMAEQQIVDPQHCSICLDDPRDPRRLPCLHVYCRVCLEKLIERRSNQDGLFPCPYCRHEHTLPEMGVDAFPVAETSSKSNVGRHGHKILCRLHNEEHSMFCIKCKRPICMHCLPTTHKGHATEDLTEFLRDRRKTLQVTVEELKENITELSTTSAYLKKEGDILAMNKDKDVANVKTQGKHMKDTIDAFVQEALSEIEKEYIAIQNNIKDTLRIIQKKYKDMQNYVDDVESIVANNERDQLLFGLDHLMQKKERILSQKIDTDIVPIQNVFTKGSYDKSKLNVMFGAVDVKDSPKEVTEPHSIFPVGPSLKPCLRNPLPIIQPGTRSEQRKSLEITNPTHYRHTAVRFLRNIKVKRYVYPNDLTGLDIAGQSLETTSRYPILPHIRQKPTKHIETSRLQASISAHNRSNTQRLLKKLLNGHSKA